MNLKTYKTEDKVFIEILEPITMNDVTFTMQTFMMENKALCDIVIQLNPEVKTILDSMNLKFMKIYNIEQTRFVHTIEESFRKSKSIVTAVKNKEKALSTAVKNANLKKDTILKSILKDINSRLEDMIFLQNRKFEELCIDIYTGPRTNLENIRTVVDTTEIDVAIDNLTKQQTEIIKKLEQVKLLKHDKLNMSMLKLINEQGITCDNNQPIPLSVKTKICDVLAQNKGFSYLTNNHFFI